MEMKGINKRYWGRLDQNFFNYKANWTDSPRDGEYKDNKIQADEITVQVTGYSPRPVNAAEEKQLLQYYKILISGQKYNTFPELIMTLEKPDIKIAMDACGITKDHITVERVSFMNFNPTQLYQTKGVTMIRVDPNGVNMKELEEGLIKTFEKIQKKSLCNPKNPKK